MSILAKHSIIKEDKSNILTIGIEAGKAKVNNPNVINATIGMMFDEEGNLFSFDSVNKTISKLSNAEKFAYASTPGSVEYHNALKHWIFQEYEEEILSNMHCGVIATPGGSGAISNTFSNYLNAGDKALLPNYMWGNYKQFLYENYCGYDTYLLFNEQGCFNLEDVKLKMQQHKLSQNRVVIVINDPCHNPTGYTMSYSEWEGLVEEINNISSDGTPVVLLYDMAYIDYDKRGLDATRQNIRLFQKFNESVMVILAFSGSKTLGLYGLRIGGQIALSKSKEDIVEFNKANKYSSRAKWSCPSTLGMNTIVNIFSDKNNETSFKNELIDIRKILISRANTFIEESKKVGLKTLPFDCGFFISIPCDNPDEVYKKVASEDAYIIPLDGVVRVTLSAITLEECKRLPALIKKYI